MSNRMNLSYVYKYDPVNKKYINISAESTSFGSNGSNFSITLDEKNLKISTSNPKPEFTNLFTYHYLAFNHYRLSVPLTRLSIDKIDGINNNEVMLIVDDLTRYKLVFANEKQCDVFKNDFISLKQLYVKQTKSNYGSI